MCKYLSVTMRSLGILSQAQEQIKKMISVITKTTKSKEDSTNIVE